MVKGRKPFFFWAANCQNIQTLGRAKLSEYLEYSNNSPHALAH